LAAAPPEGTYDGGPTGPASGKASRTRSAPGIPAARRAGLDLARYLLAVTGLDDLGYGAGLCGAHGTRNFAPLLPVIT